MKYLAFALLLSGCGAEVSDLYGEDYANDGNGAGGSSSNSSPTNGGGPNNSSSSNAGGAPSSNNSNSSNSNSSSTDSSTSTMGGAGTTDVSTTSTGPEPTATTTGPTDEVFVQCNGVACNVSAGNVCCLGTIGDSCIPEAQCLFVDTPVECDDPFDCGGGQVCCGFVDGGQNYEEIRCASECNWPDRTLCDPSGPDCEPIFSGGMLQDAVCAQSSLLPDGYLVCKLP